MDANLTDDARALLDSLFTAPEDQNRYRLTLLKKIPQSTRPSKVGEAAADLETMTLLHDRLEEILFALGLGPQASAISPAACSDPVCSSFNGAKTATATSMPPHSSSISSAAAKTI